MSDHLQYALGPCPWENFLKWVEEAKANAPENYGAVCASSANDKGEVNSRMLLYKGLATTNGKNTIPLYTNLGSQKAKEWLKNPSVSLVFWWPSIGKQVRLRGKVLPMPSELAQKYFKSRPIESQVASYTSKQSTPLASRQEMLKAYEENLKQFGKDGPPFEEQSWGGFLADIETFEFFLYQPNRLNDRFLYKKEMNNEWSIQRLWP